MKTINLKPQNEIEKEISILNRKITIAENEIGELITVKPPQLKFKFGNWFIRLFKKQTKLSKDVEINSRIAFESTFNNYIERLIRERRNLIIQLNREIKQKSKQ